MNADPHPIACLLLLQAAMSAAMRGARIELHGLPLSSPDQSTRKTCDMVVHPRFDSIGNVCGVLVEAEDVSARLLREQIATRLIDSTLLKPCWELDSMGNVCNLNQVPVPLNIVAMRLTAASGRLRGSACSATTPTSSASPSTTFCRGSANCPATCERTT